MALYNFYVGKVKRDPSLPDGIGMGDVKAINTETVARSCEEIKKVRACDHMALYNFYVGKVKRDPSLPDGIGMGDVKAINTETVARSCDEIKKVRAGG
jgi:hypothetical protein